MSKLQYLVYDRPNGWQNAKIEDYPYRIRTKDHEDADTYLNDLHSKKMIEGTDFGMLVVIDTREIEIRSRTRYMIWFKSRDLALLTKLRIIR